MNKLPPHRSAMFGRTFSRSWKPADFDPIERPPNHIPRGAQVAGVSLATVIGIALAAALVHWWTT